MNPLSVFCPATGRPVQTGIETDWSTFFGLRGFRLRIKCPECGQNHDVSVRDCYLARSQAAADADAGRPPANRHLDGLMSQMAKHCD